MISDRKSKSEFSEKADKVWKKAKLNRIPGLFIMDKHYELSHKQFIFIEHGLTNFKNQYTKHYGFYNKNAGTFDKVSNAIANWLSFNKILKLNAAAKRETSGAAVGFMSMFSFWRSEEYRKQRETLSQHCQRLEPCLNFFGSIEEACAFFIDLLIRLSIRFQHAIELLDIHSAGISKFADYIVEQTMQILIDFPERFSDVNTVEEKFRLIVSNLLCADTSTDDKFKENWADMGLRTVEKNENWTIDGLLHSPIASQEVVFIYNEDSKCQHYPPQLSTEKENLSSYKQLKY